jgi:hypothetical protein
VFLDGDSRLMSLNPKSTFLLYLKLAGLPLPTHGDGCTNPELTFAPPRKWRWDWCYLLSASGERLDSLSDGRLAFKCAIEYQGGTFQQKSGHSNVSGQLRDCEKFTEGILAGWRLILINAVTVKNGQAINWVERALRQSTIVTPHG